MKKLIITIVFLASSFVVNAQFKSLWYEASVYYKLGDSTVTVWGSDTLTNPAMVRSIIEWYINNVKVDSSIYADTSFYSLLSLLSNYADSSGYSDSSSYSDTSKYALEAFPDSLFHKDTQKWLSNADTIYGDSVKYSYTATTVITDSVKSENDIILNSGESLILDFGGNPYNYDGSEWYDDTDSLAPKSFVRSSISAIPPGDSSWVSTNMDTLKAFYIHLNSGSVLANKYIDSTSFYFGDNDLTLMNLNSGSYPDAFYVQKKFSFSDEHGTFKIDGFGYNMSATDNLTYPIVQVVGNTSYSRMSAILNANNQAEMRVSTDREILLVNTTSDEDNSMIFEQDKLTFNYDYDGLGNDIDYFVVDTNGVIFKDLSEQTTALVTNIDTAYLDGTNGTPIENIKTKTVSVGDSIQHADGTWTTGIIDAKTAIESIEFEKLQFDTSEHAYSEGTLFYDKHEKSMSFYNDIPGFKEELGRGISVRFYNNTGGTLTNGTVIRSTGAIVDGSVTFTADVAGNGSLDSIQGVAMVTADVLDENYGMATLIGQVNGLNTSAYTDNQLLWVGSNGTYIDTIPPPPNYAFPFARIAYADADSGAIYVFPSGEVKYDPKPTVSIAFTRESETITNPGTNTPALITNATNDLYTIDYNVGFTVAGDSINPSQIGVYDINYSYAFQGDASTSDDWRIGIFINGVELHTVLRTSNASNKGVVAAFKVKELTTTDWVTLKVINTTNDTRDAVFTDGVIDMSYISTQ